MTEIFDPERARRLTLLRQSTAPNVIKINPDTASFLRRYEDADVSRLKLLEAQRLRQEGEAQRNLIKLQKQRLKKRFKTGKKLPKGKKEKEKEVPQKTPLEVEIDVQERRDRLRREQALIEQGNRRLQLEDFRQQREFISAERDRQQRELQRQTSFISGQNRIAADQQIANYNAAQAALRTQATNDSRTAQAIANRREQARLEDQRAELQARQIDANFVRDREQRALRYAEIDADRARYDRDIRIAAEQREQDIARLEAERADVRERVARDDAFRHAQLQEQQRLALENLAQQQRDNTARHQLEQNRIDNQRAVDAERAITDRELIQGFTAALESLNAQRDQDPPRIGPSAEVLGGNIRDFLRSGVGGQVQPEPQRQIGSGTETETTTSGSGGEQTVQPRILRGDPSPTRRFDIDQGATESEIEREIGTSSSSDVIDGLPGGGGLTTPQIFEGMGVSPPGTGTETASLPTEAEEVQRIQDAPEDPTPRATVAERRATRSPSPRSRRSPSPRRSPERQPLTLEEQSGSSVSTEFEVDDPGTQRALSIMTGRGAPQTRQRERQEERGLTPTGRLSERTGFPVLGQRSVVRARETSPTIGAEALGQEDLPFQAIAEGTPEAGERALREFRDSPIASTGAGQVDTIAEESTLQQVGGALGGAVTGAVTGLARGAGGLVSGVAQGIGEQLPAASDVGAAVGRAGVRAVAGVGGAIYEGIAGGEPEDQPLDRGE